jgi:hypothetical protein
MSLSQVRETIQRNFQGEAEFEQLEDNLYKFVWIPGIDNKGGRARTQTVWMFLSSNSLKIASPFSSSKELNAEDALELATKTSFGVQHIFGFYALTHLILLEDFPKNLVLQFWVNTVAQAADNLDAAIDGGDDF